MRGGRVNRDKVLAFRNLIKALRKLSIISREDYKDLRGCTVEINPLMSANIIFIEKFKD